MMSRSTRLLSGLLLVLAFLLPPPPSRAATTPKSPPPKKAAPAKSPAPPAPKNASISRNPYVGAIVVEATTGRVLIEDNADRMAYPASVLKLMDLLLVLEHIRAGHLTLQDKATVSAKAARTGGSQVWLAEKEVFTVEDLLYALMIRSANDAAVALAEKVAGSTEAFVELMNRRARELGMKQTRFQSVHGLPPAAGQRPDTSTARDMAILAREVIRHPLALRYTSTRERGFRPAESKAHVIMRTHNHLLGQVEGCDGLKTGYIAIAGFSIAATAERQGRRIIAVVMGSQDRLTRDARAKELLERGFRTLNDAKGAATTSR